MEAFPYGDSIVQFPVFVEETVGEGEEKTGGGAEDDEGQVGRVLQAVSHCCWAISFPLVEQPISVLTPPLKLEGGNTPSLPRML